MSLWRREAIERFPEMRREIADAPNIRMLWIELGGLFRSAYEKDPPDNEAIARVYNYAWWALEHRNPDISNSAIVDFFEFLADESCVWRDIPRWISQEDFNMLWFAWEYATKQKFADLRKEFAENKARIDKEKQTRRPALPAGRH